MNKITKSQKKKVEQVRKSRIKITKRQKNYVKVLKFQKRPKNSEKVCESKKITKSQEKVRKSPKNITKYSWTRELSALAWLIHGYNTMQNIAHDRVYNAINSINRAPKYTHQMKSQRPVNFALARNIASPKKKKKKNSEYISYLWHAPFIIHTRLQCSTFSLLSTYSVQYLYMLFIFFLI